MVRMAKYLLLSPDPADRWELSKEEELEALRERLHKALTGEVTGVQSIPVMVGGQQTNLYIDRARLTMFALVETPDVRPSIGEPVMDRLLDEPL